MSGLEIYALTAVALSITSWVQLYIPSTKLLEEIMEEDVYHSNIFMHGLWLVGSALLTPITLYLLVGRGFNNDIFIENFAIDTSEKLKAKLSK